VTVLIRSREELTAALAAMASEVALVPTMGALHAGHDANIRAARAVSGSVLVSVFVNPMQFARSEDVIGYPRVLDRDLARCQALGVDVMWAPEVADVYPAGPVTVTVSPGDLGSELEGAARPGHFEGVLTVVTKLIGLVRPRWVCFGEKDYQQLVLVRRLVADLELGVDVIAVPTVRESDGLAMSSRNVFLDETQRAQAVKISAALWAAQSARSADAALAAAHAILDGASGFELDYLRVRDLGLGAAPRSGPARLLVAGSFGATRLIDNCLIELAVGGQF
jgi:pantoate--beta-alanine ligase